MRERGREGGVGERERERERERMTEYVREIHSTFMHIDAHVVFLISRLKV